jgi:hypothetical protein
MKNVDGIAIDHRNVLGLNRLGNGWRGERQEYRPPPSAHRTLLDDPPARYRGAFVSTGQRTHKGMPEKITDAGRQALEGHR